MKTEHIPLTAIRPDETQPRKTFDEAALTELADSIAAHGVLQPIAVRPNGDGYIIIHGERRWRASWQAGKTTIPVIIRGNGDGDAARVADGSGGPEDEAALLAQQIIENVHRENMNPVDEARAYQRLLDYYGVQIDVARAVGKSYWHINRRLKLLEYPDEILALIVAGTFSADLRLLQAVMALPEAVRIPFAQSMAQPDKDGSLPTVKAIRKAAERLKQQLEEREAANSAKKQPAARKFITTLAPALVIAHGTVGIPVEKKPYQGAIECVCLGCSWRHDYRPNSPGVCASCPLAAMAKIMAGQTEETP